MDGADKHLSATYTEKVDRLVEFDHRRSTPIPSVVLVAYRVDESDFTATLGALDAQTTTDFEVVVVDNGGHDDLTDLEALLRQYDCVRWYAKLRANYGITLGRNLGTELACGDPLIFLDDDGVPRSDFVAAHVRVHRERDVVAARGKVLPRTEAIYNDLYSWYDLGDRAFPYYINIEGNSSFDAAVFERLAGFDEALGGRAGGEGSELTYRIIRAGHDREAVIYYPEAVIYHDGASNLRSYVRKRLHRKASVRGLADRYPDLAAFRESYAGSAGGPARSNVRTIDRVRLRVADAVVEAADLLSRLVRSS